MGFEPTRAEHIGLAVQRLNHSATASLATKRSSDHYIPSIIIHLLIKRCPLRNLSNIEVFSRTELFPLAGIRSLQVPKAGCQKHIRFHNRALHPSTLAKDLMKLLNPMYNHKLNKKK